MKKALKYLFFVLAALFVGIQFIPVERTNPPVLADYNGPSEVQKVLRNSCYDCHSNETLWPWYSKIAPVSWLVAHDVKEGREELNFSNWPKYASDAHLVEEIYEEVAEGEMPMPIYLITHPSAKVSPEALRLLKKSFAGNNASKESDDEHH